MHATQSALLVWAAASFGRRLLWTGVPLALGCTLASAQTPTEDEIWGYTTTATGQQVFQTLPDAEAALRAIDAAHSVLVAAGENKVDDDHVRIVYRAPEQTLP